MKTVYPEITWSQTGENRWIGSATGYDLSAGLAQGGPHKGKWTGILNGGAIQTGKGEFGYDFDSEAEVKTALEAEMNRRIDERVAAAKKTLETYTA